MSEIESAEVHYQEAYSGINHDTTTNTEAPTGEPKQREKASPVKKQPLVPLDSFSWSEEPNYVKIYVDFAAANELVDSQVHFVSFIYDCSHH